MHSITNLNSTVALVDPKHCFHLLHFISLQVVSQLDLILSHLSIGKWTKLIDYIFVILNIPPILVHAFKKYKVWMLVRPVVLLFSGDTGAGGTGCSVSNGFVCIQ